MPKAGPLIVVEDDLDDQELLKEVLDGLDFPNPVQFYSTCQDALDYLLSTTDKPFLIVSDVNLPKMTGLQLKMEINRNEFLRQKNIPFVFLTTSADKKTIAEASEVSLQGLFVKPPTIGELTEMLRLIIGYWHACKLHS